MGARTGYRLDLSECDAIPEGSKKLFSSPKRTKRLTPRPISYSVPLDLASICVIKTNLMHYISSVYFFSQPLHVSGIFVAHHQEVYCIYTTIVLLYIDSIPPDDGLQIWPKHVEVDCRNKLRIYSASSWFLLHM